MTQVTAVRCPKCRDIVTRAYSVQYGNGEKTVSYQCDACGHAWQTTENTKPVAPIVFRNT